MVDAANGINYATDATYTAWGAIACVKNGVTPSFAGITTTNSHNSRMQPLFLSAAAPGGTVMSFGYDFHLGAGNNGNVFQITNNLNSNRTQIFTYDHLNRLATAKTQALIGQHCWGHTFGYDIWANFIDRQPLSGYSGCTGENDPPNADEKNRMIGHCYDAAGNLVELAECSVPYTHGYDSENRLVSAPGGLSFDYDGEGNRVRKSSGSTGTLYWHGTGGEVLQETDLTGVLLREFVYFNGKRIARRGDGTFQSSATIQNALLSQSNPLNQPPCNCYNYGPIPGWTSTGSETGSWEPQPNTSYNAPLPGIIVYSNGGTISQTLGSGLLANTTYTLLVDVGRRLEAGLVADYSLTLKAGSTVLTTVRRSNGTIAAGSFQTQTLTYTAGSAPPSGNVTIVLESHAPQVNFKNVRLNLSSVGPVHYFYSDHLGSSNVVTDASGVVNEESDFYPFGGERAVTDTLPDQNYKFTGKERDTETNLDYFGARYYAFNFGRFITPDEFTGGPVDAFSSSDPLPPGPLPYADITNPQSLNKYTYAYNSPLRYMDPDGHDVQLPKGPKQKEIKKSLVEMAMREKGRQLLQSVDDNKLGVVVPIQNVEKEGDLNFGGNVIYDSMDMSQVDNKLQSGEPTAPLTLDLGQAATHHSVDPKNTEIPESAPVLVGHGLSHAEGRLNEGRGVSEKEATGRAREIMSQKKDISKKEAEKFVDNIIKVKKK